MRGHIIQYAFALLRKENMHHAPIAPIGFTAYIAKPLKPAHRFGDRRRAHINKARQILLDNAIVTAYNLEQMRLSPVQTVLVGHVSIETMHLSAEPSKHPIQLNGTCVIHPKPLPVFVKRSSVTQIY